MALRAHWLAVPAEDAAWAAYLLAGGKPRQAVPTAVLRATACQLAGIDDWLFEACYQAVGDLGETIAQVIPRVLPTPAPVEESPEKPVPTPALDPGQGLAAWMTQGVLPLRGLPASEQALWLRRLWAPLDSTERFLLVKLVGGGFRVGVSRLLVERSLAEAAGLEPSVVAQRMMGYTQASTLPTGPALQAVMAPADGDVQLQEGQPYPFFLAHPVEAVETLGPASAWWAEWKFDGIRAQVVRRGAGVWIWSRGEELVTERFPEVVEQALRLPPGTVLDGELLVFQEGRPAPFAVLQTRITRKVVSKALRASTPVQFVPYDLLEWQGQDRRRDPLQVRRALLEMAVGGTFSPVEVIRAATWDTLAQRRVESRSRGVEGFMLKHVDSPYGVGRRQVEGVGGWWKWKVEPMSVDAVLVYAQAGHGRRASLYTDYTFAVWNRPPRVPEEVEAVRQAIARRDPAPTDADVDADGVPALRLVPFAKAYSGLTDAEFTAVDKVIRSSTVEKFGPVRSVVPSLVFELGFEGLSASTRHKSGVAVRFPRMLRWRTDKPLAEADTLETLKRLQSVGE